LPLMGVFIAIGHKPNTELFAGQLAKWKAVT
jgi:thioredoxin reductase